MPIPFKLMTRRSRTALEDKSITSESQYNTIDLPQNGYLGSLVVQVYGTLATNATAAGTWDANYWPYNLLNSIALRSNEGLEVYRTSGYTNKLVQIVDRIGHSPDESPTVIGTVQGTQGSKVGSIQFPTGTIAISTTYHVLVTYRIPIAVDDSLAAGLLLLQHQATRLTIDTQLNTLAKMGFTAGSAAIALTQRASMEWYSVPTSPDAQPNLDFIHRWIEDTQSWTASGDQRYKVPVNGIVSRVIVDLENNGVPMVFFATANQPGSVNLGNVGVEYASSQRTEWEDAKIFMSRARRQWSQDLPDGVLVHDFSQGGGSPLMWDGRDTYDTGALTEFAIVTNLTVTPTNGKIRYTREQLDRRVA